MSVCIIIIIIRRNLQSSSDGFQFGVCLVPSLPTRPRQRQQPSLHGTLKQPSQCSIPAGQIVQLDELRPGLAPQPLKRTSTYFSPTATWGFITHKSCESTDRAGRDQAHLKLPQFFLGSDVGEVGKVRATDSLLGQLQPGVQVGVFFHKLLPEEPPPLQSGETERVKHTPCWIFPEFWSQTAKQTKTWRFVKVPVAVLWLVTVTNTVFNSIVTAVSRFCSRSKTWFNVLNL